MSNSTVEPLILDMLEWLCKGERSYAEVMDAWRTSCPRLTVWEDANERGLVAVADAESGEQVQVTPAGMALLEQSGRPLNRYVVLLALA
jgi:hypothetical protein